MNTMPRTMKLFILLSITITLFSCIDDVELDSLPVSNILVVNSLITPDSLFSCELSKVFAINDTTNHYVENANIKIFDDSNNELICELFHLSEGAFRAISQKPIEGKTYRLEIDAEGFQPIVGTTSIPPKQEAANVTVLYVAGYEPIDQSVYSEMRFTITDENPEPNYFEIMLGTVDYHNIDFVTDRTSGTERIELENSRFLVSDAGSFEAYTTVDAVILSEGIMKYNPSSLVFSDQLFNMSSHSFVIRCKVEPIRTGFFNLFTISEELYKFKTTFYQQQYELGARGLSRFDDFAGLDFTTKAIDTYSNISGGYGIFAGYTSHLLFSRKVEKPELSPYQSYHVFDLTENPIQTND